jgi:SPP1 family predicted phage head-tail adaptor
MTLGALDEQIRLQREETTAVGGGATTSDWANVATVWASVEELKGREYRQARQTQAAETHRVTVRRPLPGGITPTTNDRLETSTGQVLRITRVKGRKRDRHYEIMCKGEAK